MISLKGCVGLSLMVDYPTIKLVDGSEDYE